MTISLRVEYRILEVGWGQTRLTGCLRSRGLRGKSIILRELAERNSLARSNFQFQFHGRGEHAGVGLLLCDSCWQGLTPNRPLLGTASMRLTLRSKAVNRLRRLCWCELI